MPKILKYLCFFLLTLALFAVLLFFLAPREKWSEQFLKQTLQHYGITDATFQVSAFTNHHIQLKNIHYGALPLSAETLDIDYSIKAGPSLEVSYTLSNIEVHIAKETASIQQVQGTANIRTDGTFDSKFTGTSLAHKSNTPVITPVNFEGTANFHNDMLTLESDIENPQHPFTIQMTGNYHIPEGKGMLSWQMPPLAFQENLLQPEQLFPALAGKMSDTSGTVSLEGKVDWSRGTLTNSSMAVILNKFSTEAFDTSVTGTSTTLYFNSLFPLTTRPNQLVHVDALGTGIPLTNADLTFTLKDINHLSVKKANCAWGKGTITTDPFTLDLVKKQSTPFTVHVDNLELEDTLNTSQEEDFTATGKLHGLIPVSIKNGNVQVHNGYLATTERGTLQYTPKNSILKNMDNPPLAVVAKLLEDFHYQSIQFTFNSDENNKITTKLALYGRNPEVYDGRLVELNVNIRGDLIDLFNQSVETYRLPEKLIEQIANGKKK